jgi:integrase
VSRGTRFHDPHTARADLGEIGDTHRDQDRPLLAQKRGNVVGASSYSRVWDEVRALALTPSQVDSPLAGRPYDLRHAGVSLWLNAGVPAPEVAERAGHSVDVLLKVYAKCIDGQEASVNGRIDGALGDFG